MARKHFHGVLFLAALIGLGGCWPKAPQTSAPTYAPPKATAKSAAKKVEIHKNIWLEIDGDKRRVLVNAIVCRRTGLLEEFLCRKMTKEHEAILSADIDAAKVHYALTLAGAEAGSPVKYQPKYTPASGTVVKVYVQYQEKGQTVQVPAQKWIRNVKTNKELEFEWVFAGSQLFQDPTDPKRPPFYAANGGDVICLANFETAMLDLPIASTQDDQNLLFEAFTERIPPEDTQVLVILEPVVPGKR